jgi:signal transduction histidine kinase
VRKPEGAAENDSGMKERQKQKAYKRRQSSVSIYFLLWAAFSSFALVIVLLFGVIQNVLLERSYKEEISRTLFDNGTAIQRQVSRVYSGSNYSAYIRALGDRYDVRVYLLKGDGTILFPAEEADGTAWSDEELEQLDFSERIVRLLEKIGSDGNAALYEDEAGEYVYGAQIVGEDGTAAIVDGSPVYLYVSKSLKLIESVVSQMNVRTLLMGISVIILSFAMSSAISGVLAKPLAEITEKAELLAKGDFTVDFYDKSYSAEMGKLADALNFARDEISKAEDLQKELIANVSHDFKTPLTMIKAYASMIQEISGDNPEKRQKHTQVIIEESDRLTALVNDVLDLSKIRSGMESLKKTVFDLSEYTYDVLEKFDYLTQTQGYTFETHIEDGLYTEADPLKIGQVLYNLIGNAVNYTGDDKIVRVTLERQDGAIRFSVTDTGKGIKPEEITTIWDRYYRSQQTHKRPVKGTGLGLSIVKTILEKHDFRFGVESVEGKGSTFYVIFPQCNV